ncbi:rRNA-processing protein Efg1 [Gracilaria domingensis]|nr:rRNA-processing protein Efg1 [Gracilaria domingensis]
MASHMRFDDNSEDGERTSSSVVHQHHVKPEFPTSKPRIQKSSSSASRKRSRSKLPANQIRSIERYLKHKEHELPASVLKRKNQELEEWKRVRTERERRAREQKFETRYKRVKFFERKKVQRILDNIAKKGDKPEDQEAKMQAQRDMQYIQRYPKNRKYIALFPSGGHTDETRKSVEQVRAIIEGSNTTPENQTASNADDNVADDFFLDEDSHSD